MYTTRDAEWTLKVNGKPYRLEDFEKWKLVREFEATAMMPVLYFEFEIDKSDLEQNGYNVLEFGSGPGERGREQHVHVMIYPDPVEPYVPPYRPGKNARPQKKWRVITDQKWDLVGMFEYAR